MPEMTIMIGGRRFEVACQEGEQPYLTAAAAMLDAEAQVLGQSRGAMPEARMMLLMSGLMLADKTGDLEDQVAQLQDRVRRQDAEIAELRGRPAAKAERVEVPVIPASVTDSLAEMAARAEALADEMEEGLAAE